MSEAQVYRLMVVEAVISAVLVPGCLHKSTMEIGNVFCIQLAICQVLGYVVSLGHIDEENASILRTCRLNWRG